MPVRPPTRDEIRSHGDDLDLGLTDAEIEDFHAMIVGLLDAYDTVESYGRPRDGGREPAYPRTGGRRAGDDPHNAWITRCSIEGAPDGPLSGWDVGIKDNVGVAGVEMTCGSRVLAGYVPDTDATLVTRLLDAGARIVGKTNMDDMAFASDGHSSAFGPTLNPRDPEYLAGGSSGGSAIAVATGEVDLAIGSDQGGSIRAPAAWCGVVGHKPTHGLVPYTGCVGVENTIDHAGPLAPDVPTAAAALSVIAGRDPDDPRQPPDVPTEDYAAALDGDVADRSIAVVEEGFDRPGAEEAVGDRVRAALDDLEAAGASVEAVSVPMHADGMDIHTAAFAQGFLAAVRGDGVGFNWRGWYNTSLVDAFGRARRSRGHDVPDSAKLPLLLGAYVEDRYGSSFYARAMNLRAELADRYEELLETYDAVAMPTTPMTAHEHSPDDDRVEALETAWTNLGNTCVFDVTGHPSLSIPCGTAAGLPVGLMLTGARFDDATVLDLGYAVESLR